MALRPKCPSRPAGRGWPSGYTLIEILVATTLTLILMTAVVQVFGGVGDGISKARRALEQFDRMRTAAQQLRLDLQGVTVRVDGRPVRPEENAGYFELIEGSYAAPKAVGSDSDPSSSVNDLTVGERGDILMFTARSASRPFVGRFTSTITNKTSPITSDVAEVAWFLRGKTLHRRVLLVVPGAADHVANSAKTTFYANNDLSVRRANNLIVPNSLADLTKRENRFAHSASAFPFDVRGWGLLGLPTLAECSSPSWMGGWTNGSTPPPAAGPNPTSVDMWDRSTPAVNVSTVLPDQLLATDGQRIADDVVLTNVIAFDVKVWEPAANGGVGAYMNLGYSNKSFDPKLYPPQNLSFPRFDHVGVPKSKLTTEYPQRVYDTGCFSYENEGLYSLDASGIPQVDVAGGTATNGFDDDSNGVIDDMNEWITSPPYPVPLRGIQIKIRCYEPSSNQVREITIEHDFLPK